MDSLNVKNINDEKIFNVVDPNGQGEISNRIRPISISINQKAETINNKTESQVSLSIYWNDTWKSILDLSFNDTLRQEYGKLVTDLTTIQKDIDMKQYKDAETKTQDFMNYVKNLSSKYTNIPEQQITATIDNDFMKLRTEKNSVKVAISNKLLNFMLRKYAKVKDLDYTKANECFSTNKFSCLENHFDIYYHSPEIFQKQAYMTVLKDNNVIGSYKVNYDQFCKFASKFAITPQKLGYSRDKMAGYIKTAEVVMQNIFFDSVDEAKEWQEMVDDKKKEQVETQTQETEEGQEENKLPATNDNGTKNEQEIDSPVKEDGGLVRPSEEFAGADELPEGQPRQQEQMGNGMAASRRINLMKKKALNRQAEIVGPEQEFYVTLDLPQNGIEINNYAIVNDKGAVKFSFGFDDVPAEFFMLNNKQTSNISGNITITLVSNDFKFGHSDIETEDLLIWLKTEIPNLEIHGIIKEMENKIVFEAYCGALQSYEYLSAHLDDAIVNNMTIKTNLKDIYYQQYNSIIELESNRKIKLNKQARTVNSIKDIKLFLKEHNAKEARNYGDFLSAIRSNKTPIDELHSFSSKKVAGGYDETILVVYEGGAYLYTELSAGGKRVNEKYYKFENLPKQAIEGDVQEQDIVPAKTETKVYLQSSNGGLDNIWGIKMFTDNMDNKKDGTEIVEYTKLGLINWLNSEYDEDIDENISDEDLKQRLKEIDSDWKIEFIKKASVTKKAEETVEEKIDNQVGEYGDIKAVLGIGDIVSIKLDNIDTEDAIKYENFLYVPLLLSEVNEENIENVIVEQIEYPFERVEIAKDKIELYDNVKDTDVLVTDSDGDEIITSFEELPIVAKQCKIKSINKAAKLSKKKAQLDKKAINSLEELANLIDNVLQDFDYYDYMDSLETGEISGVEQILSDLQENEKGTIEAIFNRVNEDEEFESKELDKLKEYYNNKFNKKAKTNKRKLNKMARHHSGSNSNEITLEYQDIELIIDGQKKICDISLDVDVEFDWESEDDTYWEPGYKKITDIDFWINSMVIEDNSGKDYTDEESNKILDDNEKKLNELIENDVKEEVESLEWEEEPDYDYYHDSQID